MTKTNYSKIIRVSMFAVVLLGLVGLKKANAQTMVAPVTTDTICAGDTVQLMATFTGSASATFTWADTTGASSLNPSTGDTVSVFPMTTTSYRVIGDTNGTMDTVYHTVVVNQLPTVTAMSTKDTVCAGDSITLTGGGASTYTWDNSVTDGVAFPLSTTTTFTVTGTDANGCKNDTMITVVANALPTVVPMSTKDTVCTGDSITLTGSGASTYMWDNGAMDGVAMAITTTTTFTVTGTDANGCSNDSSITIQVNSLPTVMAMSSRDTVCSGDSITLTGSGASTYSWDNGAMDGVAMPITATTTFMVTGTDTNGCMNMDSTTVVVNALPMVMAGANKPGICKDDTITLWASGANTYSWTDGTNMWSGDTIMHDPDSTTTYHVMGTDSNGCVGTDSVEVVVNVNGPNVQITMSSMSGCILDTVWLYGSGAQTYVWGSSLQNPLGTGDSIFDNPNGDRTYWVAGTDSLGCVGRDTVSYSVKSLPRETFSGFINGFQLPDRNACSTEVMTAQASHGRNTYTWSSTGSPLSGTTGQSVTATITVASVITCVIDSSNGCSISRQLTFQPSIQVPQIGLNWQSDSSICVGDTAVIVATGGTLYSWDPAASVVNPDQDRGELYPTTTTTYTVKTMRLGCTDDTTVQVIVNPLPDISVSNQTTPSNRICKDQADTVTITSATGVLFDWGFGVISASKVKAVAPGKTETITIAAISGPGCRAEAQVTIYVDTTCGENLSVAGLDMSNEINTYVVGGQDLHLVFGNVPAGNVEVEIINITGASVLRRTLNDVYDNDARIINIAELKNGIYLIRLKAKEYEIVNKIFK